MITRLNRDSGLDWKSAPNLSAIASIVPSSLEKNRAEVAMLHLTSSTLPRTFITPSGTSRPMPSSGREAAERSALPNSSPTSALRSDFGLPVILAQSRRAANRVNRRVVP